MHACTCMPDARMPAHACMQASGDDEGQPLAKAERRGSGVSGAQGSHGGTEGPLLLGLRQQR